MKPLLKRRTVYAATLVGMLVVISGFTFATGLFGGFTGTNGTVVNGNQATITTSTTIYGAGLSGSMFWTAAGGSGGACPSTAPSGTATNPIYTAWVSGGSGACNNVVDYILQLNFTSSYLASGGPTFTDHFTISSMFGGAGTYTTSGVSISCSPTLGATSTCTAVINIDSGIASSSPQPNLGGLEVTVTGS